MKLILLKTFLKTPKGIIISICCLLISIEILFGNSVYLFLPMLFVIFIAGLVDFVFLYLKTKKIIFPASGIITGLIISLVANINQPWYVLISLPILAIISKYVLKNGKRPLFNPAAFALLIFATFFSVSNIWWGALSNLNPIFLIIILITGLFITNRVNKIVQVATFLGIYFLLFTLISLVFPDSIYQIFRVPFINAVLFFAFFILTDPPTSPARDKEQSIYGFIVAISSVISYFVISKSVFLLIGLLFGNFCLLFIRKYHNYKTTQQYSTIIN